MQLDRYTASHANSLPVRRFGASRIAVPGARSAPRKTVNQIAAGGSGVDPGIFGPLLAGINDGLAVPVPRYGAIGTGDLTALAETALCLLGERDWLPAGSQQPRFALAPADVAEAAVFVEDGERTGLEFARFAQRFFGSRVQDPKRKRRHSPLPIKLNHPSGHDNGKGPGSHARATALLRAQEELLADFQVVDDAQGGLFPVAYTIGTDFKPAHREPLATVVHWDRW
jgi:hypothetical protein